MSQHMELVAGDNGKVHVKIIVDGVARVSFECTPDAADYFADTFREKAETARRLTRRDQA